MNQSDALQNKNNNTTDKLYEFNFDGLSTCKSSNRVHLIEIPWLVAPLGPQPGNQSTGLNVMWMKTPRSLPLPLDYMLRSTDTFDYCARMKNAIEAPFHMLMGETTFRY